MKTRNPKYLFQNPMQNSNRYQLESTKICIQNQSCTKNVCQIKSSPEYLKCVQKSRVSEHLASFPFDQQINIIVKYLLTLVQFFRRR